MSNSRRTALDHAQDQQRQSEHYTRRQAIKDAVELCSKALDKGETRHYHFIAVKLQQDILPALQEQTNTAFVAYDSALSDQRHWDWVAFSRFLENSDAYIDTLTQPQDNADLSYLDGFHDRSTSAKLTVKKSLESVVAICEYEDILMDDYAARVDAVGFSIKLGEQLKRGDMDFGDPVQAVTRAQGALKSFYAGNTGTGKTVAALRQFEDYYRSQFEGGRRYKCIDYVGLGRAENIMYDVPQQQSDLVTARTEHHDLPPDYTHIDGVEPAMDLYVPKTTNLTTSTLPYNTDDESFVPQPFTIPASDLPEGLLASLIDSQVAKRRVQTIRDAYQVVDARMTDWALADLAEEIAHRDELSEKHIKDALRVLRGLQDSGFIRTHEDDHTLDWGDIMYSTERVTVFSQSLLEDEFEQLMVVAYLLYKHWDYRWRNDNYPTAAVWLRELWEIAPHQGQRSKRPDRETAVIKFIIDRLIKIMRKPRDISTHLLSDTQQPNDVEKAVRQQFNRFLVFDANQGLVESIMQWEGQPKQHAYDFLETMSGDAGRGGIIGGCEPAIDPNRWGVSPIQFAPPSWHHHDKENDGSGWSARTEYADDEVLRSPDWATSVPDKLAVDVSIPDDEDDSNDGDGTPSGMVHLREEAQELYKQGYSYSEIIDELDNNPRTGNPVSKSTISSWCSDLER